MSTRCFAALLHALFLINADARQVCHDNILAALGNEFIGPTRFERDLGAVGNDAERVDGGDALDVGKRNVRFAGLNVETVGFKDDALIGDVQTPADGFGPAPHIRRRVEKKLFRSVFHGFLPPNPSPAKGGAKSSPFPSREGAPFRWRG